MATYRLELFCLLRLLLLWRRNKRKWYVRPLNQNRLQDGEFSTLVQNMRDLDEERHYQYFKMSASRFDDLVQRIAPHINHQNTHRCPVSVSERLAVTLRYLASGIPQQAIAASYRLGKSSVSQIVTEVCRAIWKSLQTEFVCFPTQKQWVEIAQDFWTIWNFPLCLGAIDGKHVQIRAPPRSGSDNLSYKGKHSFVLMAACDAHYRFTMVDVSASGFESDGDIFKDSTFGSKLLGGTIDLPPPGILPGTDVTNPYVFLGNDAFPLHENLMHPYPGTDLTKQQQVYNYWHSRARTIIENAFGIMASRWRILGRPIGLAPEKTVHVVKACVALHNYLTQTDAANSQMSRYIPKNYTDSITPTGDIHQGEWRRQVEGDTNLLDVTRLSVVRATHVALNTRHNLMTFFQTDQGQVPWQETVIGGEY